MPATSSVSSGDRPQVEASVAASMTSAICSTGMLAGWLLKRAARSRIQPPNRPSRKEPQTTNKALATQVSASLASVPWPASDSSGHSFSTSIASTLLIAHIISSRSPTWPRGRSSCIAAMVMIGEVLAATIAASTADSSGAPSHTRAAPTASAAHRPSSTQLAANQGLSINQRGRSRLPSSNTSAAMARSMIGFQPSRSAGCSRPRPKGLARTPTSMVPASRGSFSSRCIALAATTAISITVARPSTGSSWFRSGQASDGSWGRMLGCAGVGHGGLAFGLAAHSGLRARVSGGAVARCAGSRRTVSDGAEWRKFLLRCDIRQRRAS